MVDLNTKISEIDDYTDIKGFAALASAGVCSKEDIQNKLDYVQNKIDEISGEIADLESEAYEIESNMPCDEDMQNSKILEEQTQIKKEHKRCNIERNKWADLMTKLEEALVNFKNFDKTICFSNIRHMLKENPNIKIGQIEKEANVRLGYTSRLEKPDNTSEPSIEYVMSAAKLLGVSLDSLLLMDYSDLSETEKYLVKFTDKLKADTIADKLEWVKENADSLNRPQTDMNGNPEHPLLSQEEFYEESEGEYPNLVDRIVFVSNTFGPRTYIAGDCFNLRLKNGTYLYLMNISKSVHKQGDMSAYAKELWIYKSYNEKQYLLGSQDDSPIAKLIDSLYEIVSENNKHPKIQKDLKSVMDAFMQDDMEDDPVDESLPFV